VTKCPRKSRRKDLFCLTLAETSVHDHLVPLFPPVVRQKITVEVYAKQSCSPHGSQEGLKKQDGFGIPISPSRICPP
jgi:hypothetical protein